MQQKKWSYFWDSKILYYFILTVKCVISYLNKMHKNWIISGYIGKIYTLLCIIICYIGKNDIIKKIISCYSWYG